MIVVAALLGASPAEAGALRKYEHAAAKGKVRKLTRGLRKHRSYIRELSARSLAALPPSDEATHQLLTCVGNEHERDWVRSACASTLAQWKVDAAVPTLAYALGTVGAESRYWLADALHRLGGPDARAALLGLTSDTDLFVSTAAREWTR